MADRVSTVANTMFTTEDITHKPRRYQSDNLRQARGTTEEQAKSNAEKPAESYTLERAIRFYQDNAVGEYRALYTATASWLEELRKTNRTKLHEETLTEKEGEEGQMK